MIRNAFKMKLSSGDVESFRRLGARLLGPELDRTERWEAPTDGGVERSTGERDEAGGARRAGGTVGV